jgi:predicted MFS family arabinose efflux permease
MQDQLKHYLTITGGYWAFTVTDGAIRMLVVLYFHQLGYSPFEVAMLFLFYEFFGIVTNLVGGWLGARIGLNRTMHIGMALQIAALVMLTVPDAMLSVIYVMLAQAISGIAKDLNKMSAKASVKTIATDSDGKLFKWVAALTGSKNALKGAGFFIGAALLEWTGFRATLWILSGALAAVFVITLVLLPRDIGKTKAKAKFTQVFSNTPAVNWLSAARFFLFGSRDVWFVVGLPVFLYEVLGWSFTQVGGFLALWVIGYGFVQAGAPKLMRDSHPGGASARLLAFGMALIPAGIALGLSAGFPADTVLIVGLLAFGAVFAINSSVHSYLILAYSDHDKVSMNVGFYYMANAGGRLAGTVLSGLIYQHQGLEGCLWWSAGFLIAAGLLSFKLPSEHLSTRAS